MVVLAVISLPDETRDSLRERAAHSGHNMEVEVRDILIRAALEPHQSKSTKILRERVRNHYGSKPPGNVVDEFIAERRRDAGRE